MAHISENWPDLLTPVFRKIVGTEYYSFTKNKSSLGDVFNMDSSDKNFEKFSQAGALGDWDEFTGTVGYDDSYQGYDKTFYFTEYAKGIKVERKLADDDLYRIINARPAELGYSAARTREKHGFSVLNNAFTDEPTDGDGAELCASDHPSAAGAAAQSNEGTTAFSATAVEATRRLMVAFKGDQGETISGNPDMLILPIALEEQGYEIINSKGKVDVATNNVNFHMGRYKMLVVPNFLTNAKNWFMTDSDRMKKNLWWFDRIPLEFMQDKDSDTLLAKYIGYMRYGYGWTDWKFIYGHKPA